MQDSALPVLPCCSRERGRGRFLRPHGASARFRSARQSEGLAPARTSRIRQRLRSLMRHRIICEEKGKRFGGKFWNTHWADRVMLTGSVVAF